MWVGPRGAVFGISSDRTWVLDPTGAGAIVTFPFKTPANADTRPNIGPTSTAVCCPSMNFSLRSSWAQFSTMTSTSPVPKPCQATSSLRSFFTTVHPSLVSATSATTAALAS